MSRVELHVPESIIDSLPANSDDTVADMDQAVDGWQRRLDAGFEQATTDREAAQVIVDVISQMEDRLERYDAFVPELRAWGQSPIYAIAWRNLYAALIGQLETADELTDAIDKERNARLVEDGIRWQNVE